MKFGDDLSRLECASCDKPLLSDPRVPLIYEPGDGWYHEKCFLKAKRALAAATKLARLSRAIAEYAYYRDAV